MITPQIFKSTCFKVKLERPCTCAVIQMNTFKTFESGIKWDHKRAGDNSIVFVRRGKLCYSGLTDCVLSSKHYYTGRYSIAEFQLR